MTQQSTPRSFDFPAIHAKSVTDLDAFLAKNRYCYLIPDGEENTKQATALIDTQTGTVYSLPSENLTQFLNEHQFIYVHKAGIKSVQAVLQVATGIFWNHAHSDCLFTLDEGHKIAQKGKWAQLNGWQVPTERQLRMFANSSDNPYNSTKGCLTDKKNKPVSSWLTTSGVNNIADDQLDNNPKSSAALFACNNFWEDRSSIKRLIDLATQQWELVSLDGKVFESPKILEEWSSTQTEYLLLKLKKLKSYLKGTNTNAIFEASAHGLNLHEIADIDFIPCRLPKLNELQIRDPEKGLWELFGINEETLKHFGAVSRDPMRDVKRRAVAIDFGTSSTVVAMDTPNGNSELLRIGVRDPQQKVQPTDFENPTVLECIDFSAFEEVWTQQAYRPALNWDWMRAAHEAQANLRDNPGETQILASIMPSLKRWALRSSEQRRTRITDRTNHEITLAPHAEYNPVRGQALSVDANYPFDPIELYAWFLGMAINWRERGIFLDYYLSFPVKYSREVKDRILASFRRGLQRSLPQTLITHHPEILNDFKVHDLASEPAAYAAAAMKYLKIQPTEDDGIPYAVFDFGGGTSDFDYGLLRWATEEEEDQGYEQVFEHLASSGDNYLGGENLLESLVYATFCQNLDTLRERRIQFTRPDGTETFPGSEAFLSDTQAAQTNVIMLAAKLRAFLEADEATLPENQLNLTLLDSNGQKAENCVLELDSDKLDELLLNKIRAGLEAFLAQLAQLRDELPKGESIHVLLAGNGCRSRHIKNLTQGAEWTKLLKQAFGNKVPDIVVHDPLPMNEAEPYAPTTKTGVALGLLRLTPGKNTLLINHVNDRHNGQAPFTWFVGRMRRGTFDPKLSPGATYGQWHEVGPLQQGVFNLYASSSPRAHQGMAEGDVELRMLRQDFHAAPVGAKLFARAVKPHEIELTAALDLQSIDENSSTVTLMLE